MLRATFATVSTISASVSLAARAALNSDVAQFAALHDDVSGEIQNCFGAFIGRRDFARIGDLVFTESNQPPSRCVRYGSKCSR